MFTAFIIYEQHEAEVEMLIARFSTGISTSFKKLKTLLKTKLPDPVTSFLHDNHILDLDNGSSQKQQKQQFQPHE